MDSQVSLYPSLNFENYFIIIMDVDEVICSFLVGKACCNNNIVLLSSP